jgi:hypothetical protein
MMFEFQLGEVQLWCSSPRCIRGLVERGARLVDPARSDELRRVLESARPAAGPAPSREWEPCPNA